MGLGYLRLSLLVAEALACASFPCRSPLETNSPACPVPGCGMGLAGKPLGKCRIFTGSGRVGSGVSACWGGWGGLLYPHGKGMELLKHISSIPQRYPS